MHPPSHSPLTTTPESFSGLAVDTAPRLARRPLRQVSRRPERKSREEAEMALQGGHRFEVSFGTAFPYGVYAMGVEQAMDYDEKSGRRSPSRDKQNGNELVFAVVGLDRDPEARQKQIK